MSKQPSVVGEAPLSVPFDPKLPVAAKCPGMISQDQYVDSPP
jgi:hypothetical protein